MKTVLLLVDRDAFWHQQLRVALQDHPFEILGARDATEARRILVSRPDTDVVVLDDCISGAELDALELVVEIRRGFQGRMIACCTDCNNGAALMGAGCDEHVYKSKLAEHLLERQRAKIAV
jgi:DNA-binding response OmpR family regulator